MYFYGLNVGPPGGGHLGPWDLGLNKVGKKKTTSQCYIQNFKHLGRAVLEKEIFKYFSFLNPRPYVPGPF